MRKIDNTVAEVFDKGLEKLPELWDMLLEEAKGVPFVVFPDLPTRDKPKLSAKFVAKAQEVERVCNSCRQPVVKDPPVLWEVWRTRRDSVMLKYLFDQLVGKAKMKEQERVDPEIIVVFGDIDSVAPAVQVEAIEETVEERGNGVTELEGSVSNVVVEESEELGIE